MVEAEAKRQGVSVDDLIKSQRSLRSLWLRPFPSLPAPRGVYVNALNIAWNKNSAWLAEVGSRLGLPDQIVTIPAVTFDATNLASKVTAGMVTI